VVAQNVIFGVIAAAMIVAAFKVVTTRNVVRAVLYLVVVLAGAAAQFLLLAAEFVALVQGDDASRPDGRGLLLARVLHGDGRLQHRPEGDAEAF